jgi:hypothetical protein
MAGSTMTKPNALPSAKKPRKRPSMRGYPGVERGSPAAAALFWKHAIDAKVKAGVDDLCKLPEHKRYGFDGPPTPPTAEAQKQAREWHRIDREWHRSGFEKMPESARLDLYFMAMDRHLAGWQGAPDPYIYGFDEFPERPADRPVPSWVEEFRAALRGEGSRPVHAALAFFGLAAGCSLDDVRKAFRRVVSERRLHPDQGGDPESFKEALSHMHRAIAVVSAKA